MSEPFFNDRPNKNEKMESIAYIKMLIKRARNNSNFEDIPKLEKLIELISSKRYGLVWEKHAEKVEEEMKTKIPVFKEIHDFKIHDNVNSDAYNFLLEGDNLHSLYLLQKTHLGKIDIIYIDPPYNTGKKDFKYNDSFVDKNDSFAHSKWLSFMERRLNIAKTLLSENGFIFVSIDENEQAQLKMLMDEIYGEKNFLTQFIVENNPKGRKNSNFSSVTSEYCIAYAKKISNTYFVENIPKAATDMKLDEEGNYVHGSGRRVIVGQNNFNNQVTNYNSDKHYSIYFRKSDRTYHFIKEYSLDEINTQLVSDGYNRYYSYRDNSFVENTYTMRKLEQLIADQALDFAEDKIYEKNFRSVIRVKNLLINKKYQAIIDNKKVEYELDIKTTSAKQQLAKLLGKKSPFDYPKNPGLIRLLITLSDNKNATILDFFAGSGTTGQAVIEQNAIDGGKRKFILATNNENNIAIDVTYERMKRVSLGSESYDSKPVNLKYFKTKFVDKEDENLEYALLNNVKNLIELEHGIDLEKSDIAVAFNLSEIKNLDLTGIRIVYMRDHSHSLMDKDDIIRYEGIEIIDVPEYYFSKEMSEAGL